MTPPAWFGQALALISALIVVLMSMAGIALAQDMPRYWWAERLVCLPDTVEGVPPMDRCGLSRIGPWESPDECQVFGPLAWQLEARRMVAMGWGGLMLGDLHCAYHGPPNTVS